MNDPGIYTEAYYFGIYSQDENLSTFELVKETDNETFTDFTIENENGHIIKEDEDIILEISIDMTLFGQNREYDSITGSTKYITKLNEEEYVSFLS
jgi:hypothetical protein